MIRTRPSGDLVNNLGRQEPAPINKAGLRIDYGTSYVQTVTFDAKGPVAQAILTYGQSTNPASPHANDQMRAFSAKRWHTLPFHRDDVVKARVGEPLQGDGYRYVPIKDPRVKPQHLSICIFDGRNPSPITALFIEQLKEAFDSLE